MKKIFTYAVLTLAALALSTHIPHKAHAAILGAPFIPEIDQRFNALEGPNGINTSYPAFRNDSNAVLHTAQATWDFSVNGGATGTTDLHVSIPKNAIIIRSWVYTLTNPITTAGGTISFKCENASDIIAATAAESYGSYPGSIDGASTGAASAFKYIDNAAASCDIQVVIATGAVTAGKLTAYVQYVLHK